MEVTCVLLLTFVCLVSATPYRYGGVKAGAAAKAEAGAVSGGFPGLHGLPIPIPSGAGYSGSFSKASSYASSSASSSSSSFSFSDGGQGTGCSGGCQNNGAKTNYQYGSAPNSFGSASAGAVAGSAGLIKNEGPCSGNDCNSKNDANKCSSGQCGLAGAFASNDINGDKEGTKPTGYSVTECAEGNCEQAPTINTGQAYTNNQNKAPEATPTAYASASSYLTTPKLAPSNRPSSYNVPIQSVYETSSNRKPSTCTYGNCGNEDSPSGDNIKHNKPSTYLEAPAYNNKPVCTGDACGSNDSPKLNDIGPIPSFLPLNDPNKIKTGSSSYSSSYSSYAAHNKPSYGTAPVTQLTGPYGLSPSTNPTHPAGNAPATPTGSACGAGGDCVGNQQNYPTIGPDSIPTCTTPGCKSPTSPPFTSANTDTKKHQTYTGSFGGPPGILRPNEYDLPSKPGSVTPSNTGHIAQPTAIKPVGTIPSGSIHYPQQESSSGSYKPNPLPCFLGNCDQGGSTNSVIYPTDQPSGPSSVHKPTEPVIYPSGPSNAPSGSYKPTGPVKYPTEYPTAPSGSYKPNGPVTYPSEQPIKPTGSYKPTGPLAYPTEQQSAPSGNYNPGSYQPTGPLTYPTGQPIKPTGSYKPTGPVMYPTGQPIKPTGSYKPTGPVTYPTGQPSAPSGNYNPGSYQPTGPVIYPTGQPIGPSGSYNSAAPATYPTGISNIPSGTYQPTAPNQIPCFLGNCDKKPTANYPSTGGYTPTGQDSPSPCSSGNCNQGPSSGASVPSYVPNVPSGSYKPTGPHQIPCFLGNCDKKPTANYPSTGGYTPIGQDSPSPCSSGNCNQGPSSGASPSYEPNVPSGSYKPTGAHQIPCFLGNCNNEHDNHKPTGTNNVQCSSGNCNQGSATGPASSAVPSYEVPNIPTDSGKPSEPSSTSNHQPTDATSSCSSGTCNNAASSSVTASQSGYNPVKAPSGHYKPSGSVACSSGNCNQPAQFGSASTAGATAQAGSVYTGGFGGPPGLLTPYDNGKLVPTGKQLSLPHTDDHSGSSNGANSGSQSGGLASASAGTSAGSYGAQNGESGDGKHSGCNSGCGGGNNNGGSSYAIASAGAVSSGKSYAHSGAFASSSASAHAGAQTKSGYSGR